MTTQRNKEGKKKQKPHSDASGPLSSSRVSHLATGSIFLKFLKFFFVPCYCAPINSPEINTRVVKESLWELSISVMAMEAISQFTHDEYSPYSVSLSLSIITAA